jgi:DNA-binding NtrC family response regulator
VSLCRTSAGTPGNRKTIWWVRQRLWCARHGVLTMKPLLLVIDDDALHTHALRTVLESAGFEVQTVASGQAGLERVAAHTFKTVLLDVHLPGEDGFEILEGIKRLDPLLPVVMVTASHDARTVVRALKMGAIDFVPKPVDRDETIAVVRRALEARALQSEVETLRRRVRHQPHDLPTLMGSSAQIARVVEQVHVVAASSFTVLVLGETGTGKELVAQAIHQESARRGKAFVALDCGAIPELLLESELFGHEKGAFTGAERRKVGRLRLAEGGTCVLDEIGNLPLGLQAKLLRVLESRQVHAVGAEQSTPMDVRFVASTNDDLQVLVQRGQFRADLYFRLAQFSITLPPLRERPDDVPFLAQRFLEEASVELRKPVQSIVPEALRLLRDHPWPGNVRELRNVIRKSVLQTTDIALRVDVVRSCLGVAPEPRVAVDVSGTLSLREHAAHAARAAELQAIREALRLAGGNKAEAARLLRTDYKTLHVKMKALGIVARELPERPPTAA